MQRRNYRNNAVTAPIQQSRRRLSQSDPAPRRFSRSGSVQSRTENSLYYFIFRANNAPLIWLSNKIKVSPELCFPEMDAESMA